jgi:hypothetical protein
MQMNDEPTFLRQCPSYVPFGIACIYYCSSFSFKITYLSSSSFSEYKKATTMTDPVCFTFDKGDVDMKYTQVMYVFFIKKKASICLLLFFESGGS